MNRRLSERNERSTPPSSDFDSKSCGIVTPRRRGERGGPGAASREPKTGFTASAADPSDVRQAVRVEYCMKGTRVSTDFIANLTMARCLQPRLPVLGATPGTAARRTLGETL